jgi:DNA-binding NtrC family response regulator
MGDSAAMRLAREAIGRLGPSRSTVLLMAETGCGKEVAARALHAASGLRGEFVAVNCAAVPENLFEAQFFGHRAGAFTGAAAHDGFFRAAIGGTLFLDEIGELPLAQQPKLLRAIQERAVVPLGGMRPIPCDVRIVAATNRNLAHEVEQGTFRADLLARLFESQIRLPTLRERREDILELFFQDSRGKPPPMTHPLAEALLVHDWPYNVRELLAAARELAEEAVLDLPAFQRRLGGLELTPAKARTELSPTRPEFPPLDLLELSRILAKNGGSVARVAREVGRSRRQIYRWIEKYGIDVRLFRHSDEREN